MYNEEAPFFDERETSFLNCKKLGIDLGKLCQFARTNDGYLGAGVLDDTGFTQGFDRMAKRFWNGRNSGC